MPRVVRALPWLSMRGDGTQVTWRVRHPKRGSSWRFHRRLQAAPFRWRRYFKLTQATLTKSDSPKKQKPRHSLTLQCRTMEVPPAVTPLCDGDET